MTLTSTQPKLESRLRRLWRRYYLLHHYGMQRGKPSTCPVVAALVQAALDVGLVMAHQNEDDFWQALGLWNYQEKRPTTLVLELLKADYPQEISYNINVIDTLVLTFHPPIG